MAAKAGSKATSKKVASRKATPKAASKAVSKAAPKVAAAKAVRTTDLAKLKVKDFSPFVGKSFGMALPQAAQARTQKSVVALKLVKAEPNGVQRHASSKPEDKVRTGGGFSLEFVAPEEHGLPQGIYRVEHPKLGMMEIFLVPSGPAHGGFGYHTSFA